MKVAAADQNIMEPTQMIFCYVCERDVTNITHALDEPSKAHLCLKCFATGKEKKDFKRGQPYRIINNLNFHLLSDGWTAQEELLLLEGLQSMGFGNWTDISKQIGSKSKEQCELHHINVRSPQQFWLKNHEYLDMIQKTIETRLKDGKVDRKNLPKMIQDLQRTQDNSDREQKTLIEQKLARYADKIEKTRQAQKSETTFNDILGFMPLRRDFDVEYDNEAELFLAEMEFDGTAR